MGALRVRVVNESLGLSESVIGRQTGSTGDRGDDGHREREDHGSGHRGKGTVKETEDRYVPVEV